MPPKTKELTEKERIFTTVCQPCMAATLNTRRNCDGCKTMSKYIELSKLPVPDTVFKKMWAQLYVDFTDASRYQEWPKLAMKMMEEYEDSLPKSGMMCSNCAHARPSALEWFFCREPERMKGHEADFNANKAPAGGYPQSRNHTCPQWKLKKETTS